DDERQPTVYEPSALSNTEIILRRINKTDKKELERNFINYGAGEKSHEFRSTLNTALSTPKEYETLLFEDGVNVLGLCLCKNNESEITVVLCRFTVSRLARTLSWHAIWLLIQKCVKQQKARLVFSDKNTS